MMTRRLLLTGLCLLATLPLARAEKSPFEGKWVLDKAQSQGAEAPDDLTQVIKVKNDKVDVRSTWKEPRGGMLGLSLVGIAASEMRLGIGGETNNKVGPYEHQSKTTIEGNRMVTEWSAALPDGSMQGRWTRTLADDGRTMTLLVESKSSDGKDSQATLAFRKK